MRKALKFTLIVVAILTLPWLTSIAYGNINNDSVPGDIRVEVADRMAAPAATFFGCTHGSITPGDLFYIDASTSSRNLVVNLYITNVPEITCYLKYLILKVSVYLEIEDGRWQRAVVSGNTTPESSCYLTLCNNPARFFLYGNSRFKISIDSGSYYCMPATVGNNNEPPHFYLAVEPA